MFDVNSVKLVHMRVQNCIHTQEKGGTQSRADYTESVLVNVFTYWYCLSQGVEELYCHLDVIETFRLPACHCSQHQVLYSTQYQVSILHQINSVQQAHNIDN